MTFPSLFQKGKKMGTNAGQAGGATSDPANPIWTLLVWKLKTAAVLFLHIVALQGRYRARNRRVGTWYVNTFSSSVMYGSAPTGQHLMEVGLSRPPYLPQTVSKEQSSRKGGKRGGAGGWRATGQKATGLLLVSDSHRRGHAAGAFTLTGRTPFIQIPLCCFHFALYCFLNKMFKLIIRPGSNIKVPPIIGGILELFYANLTITCRIVWQIPVNLRRSSPKTQMQIPADRS